MCAILMTSAYVTRAETTPGVYDTFMESQNGTETEEEDNVILGYDMCSQDECGCPKPNQFPGKHYKTEPILRRALHNLTNSPVSISKPNQFSGKHYTT